MHPSSGLLLGWGEELHTVLGQRVDYLIISSFVIPNRVPNCKTVRTILWLSDRRRWFLYLLSTLRVKSRRLLSSLRFHLATTNMPIEPLSITASVIGVTRLTYDSCKALNHIIKGLKNAPASLEALQKGLNSFEAVIKPLEQDFADVDDPDLSPHQRASLGALQPVLQLCRTACDGFSERLTELTSHSDDNRFALRDRFRLHFNDSDIRVLKENLAQGQRTLSDALGFANLCAFPRVEHGYRAVRC